MCGEELSKSHSIFQTPKKAEAKRRRNWALHCKITRRPTRDFTNEATGCCQPRNHQLVVKSVRRRRVSNKNSIGLDAGKPNCFCFCNITFPPSNGRG
jgi:hypothetical protein